ncbi:BTB/POZ domain-containing protein At1g21780 [Linum perenne]
MADSKAVISGEEAARGPNEQPPSARESQYRVTVSLKSNSWISRSSLQMLQVALVYQLKNLKSRCLRYSFRFRKVHDVREDFHKFSRLADMELILEMFWEALNR